MAIPAEHGDVGIVRGNPDVARVEPWPRRVRAFVDGVPIADSSRVSLLLEPRRLPVFYFPTEDVRMERLVESGKQRERKGDATRFAVSTGGRKLENAAWMFADPAAEFSAIRSRVAFVWDAMDSWFEEDDEVFVHPRDPYHRVDVLNSSRHVRVDVRGVTVAETHRPRLLFETGLPTRYYIPKVDVRMELLRPTALRTRCPYKGEAVYWAVVLNGEVTDDIVWSYPSPIPECPKIENLVCFFNELVDIHVDGEPQARPQTPWSRR